MYNAQRWHDEFPAPMFIHDKCHIFVNDFVVFDDINLGETIGKVLRIFKDEGWIRMSYVIYVLVIFPIVQVLQVYNWSFVFCYLYNKFEISFHKCSSWIQMKIR